MSSDAGRAGRWAERRETGVAPPGASWHARVVKSLLVAFVLGLALATPAPAGAADDHPPGGYEDPDAEFDEPVEGAKRLEGRLLAPCCWDSSRQTLDIHGSPVANQLRREIRSRLRAGETPEAVEADLVRRYSPKILAVPPGNPLREIGIALSVLVVLGAAGAVSLLVRWRRRGQAEGIPTPPGDRDEWDERLDAELREVDDRP
jgi:cytochrome c-type biogenesis protein CcmH